MKQKWIAIMLASVLMSASLAMAQEAPATESDESIGSLLSSLLDDENVEEALGSLSESGEGLGEMVEGIVNSLSDESGELSGLLSEIKEKYGDINLDELLAEDGPLAQLLGENGEALKQLIGENGENLEQLIGENGENLEQLLGEAGPLAELFGENSEGLQELGGLIGSLVGSYAGSDEGTVYADPSVVLDEYAKDRSADFAPCDVTFQVPLTVAGGTDETGVFTYLGVFWIFNYNIEDNQLVFASGEGQAALLSAIPQEDGSYQYTADEAADGEGYSDDIARLCEELGSGITPEEFFSATGDEQERDILLLMKFLEYTQENPEITAIDLNGEMITVDQANQIIEDYLETALSGLEGLFETEEETETL